MPWRILGQTARHVLKLAGLEIRRIKPSTAEFRRLAWHLHRRDIETVLDVGANKGQFASKLFAAAYKGKIISFEPMPDVHATLLKQAGRNPRWEVAPPMALGKTKGSALLHIAANSISSSLLPMEQLHLDAAPNSFEIGLIEVPVERLDEILPELLPTGTFLLKMDTQGTENDILEGAVGVMERVVGINAEMSFQPLYKGQPLFDEMFRLITGLGFKLATLTPVFQAKKTRQELFCCDGLFLRPSGVPSKTGSQILES